jgi:hypothetical protein
LSQVLEIQHIHSLLRNTNYVIQAITINVPTPHTLPEKVVPVHIGKRAWAFKLESWRQLRPHIAKILHELLIGFTLSRCEQEILQTVSINITKGRNASTGCKTKRVFLGVPDVLKRAAGPIDCVVKWRLTPFAIPEIIHCVSVETTTVGPVCPSNYQV